eukprot:CAMPEP_0116147060 /NCGR_PEP_ID=MMETSP0329-20121206/17544_1 /TAXON_ID=697910 /ORGANISM="Pseudo-nitzschia arenysensis, Strain B593" /LENGTH=390 /DNA_ID=CAMNT_0003642945 /DNA_START=110 /DNA_END=1282 /DNA_ORIENTATION=+
MLRFALHFALCGTLAHAFVLTSNSNNNNNNHYRHCETTQLLAESATTTTTTTTTTAATNTIDSVVERIDELYPPQGLDQRIALSRKDGYWPFISTGEDPPQQYVYGEFDIGFLNDSLMKACDFLLEDVPSNNEIVFCDLGSGTGRLVLAAAALHPEWKVVKGIELLETIYQEAVDTLESCRRRQEQQDTQEEEEEEESSKDTKVNNNNCDTNIPQAEFELSPDLPCAPIELECGSFTDPYSTFYDADILFCFSSCLPPNIRVELARSIGRQSKPGTIVITTEYPLPGGGPLDPLEDDPEYPSGGNYEIEMLESFSGNCTAVGGISTVYIHRVTKSLGTGKARIKPKLPVSELAYRAIVHMEENDTSTAFLRQVSNNMAFLGFPDSWRPKA